MKPLSAADILGADDLPREKVEVPEWGGSVWVRTMTGKERDAFESSVMAGEQVNLRNIRAKLCSVTICDREGKRLFGAVHVEQLGAKSALALDRLFTVAQRLNGIGDRDVEALKKTFNAGPSGNSGSA